MRLQNAKNGERDPTNQCGPANIPATPYTLPSIPFQRPYFDVFLMSQAIWDHQLAHYYYSTKEWDRLQQLNKNCPNRKNNERKSYVVVTGKTINK